MDSLSEKDKKNVAKMEALNLYHADKRIQSYCKLFEYFKKNSSKQHSVRFRLESNIHMSQELSHLIKNG